MDRAEIEILYSLLHQFLEYLKEGVNRLGQSGLDDEASAAQGDVDVVQAALDIVRGEVVAGLPPDMVTS